MRRMGARARDARGQSTAEAAVALPVVFLLVLLLVQPGIVLYDRMVMAGAAAEGCRLLATSDGDAATCEEYVRRRLGAIPPSTSSTCMTPAAHGRCAARAVVRRMSRG